MTTIHIRPFIAADYSAYAWLKNTIYPEYASAVPMFRHKDEIKDPKCRAQRFLAEQDGRVIGSGEFSQNPWTYHPQKFDLDFNVVPAYRRRGIGQALFHRVLQALAPFNPQRLRSKAREDKEGVHFLSHYGFLAVEQEDEYWLDPAGFDFTPYAGLEEHLAAQGIHIVTMATLMAHDPAHKEKLYALNTGDKPGRTEEVTTLAYDFFLQSQFDPAIFLPEAYFVAVLDGRYLGLSNLESMGADNKLMVGYTGVVPAFRRRGIALALKLRTIRYAVAQGNPTLITSSMSYNQPMLALNKRLGFNQQTAWIHFQKDL